MHGQIANEIMKAGGLALEIMDQLSDDVLIQRSARGERDAFAALYDRYVEQIYRHVYRRMPSQADAEDITQEVFIRAWRAIPKYKKGDSLFVSWLLVIARNLITDFYRARKKNEVFEEESFPAAAEASPESEAELSFNRRELREAISKLKDTQQKVILMRFIDGFSYEEISGILGKSEGAVRVIQHRALSELKKVINKFRARK